MQFHLNGFRPGDPHVAEASAQAAPHTDAVPAQVDVLIVGCGPAGLTLAAQLAAFPDIRTCIVEQKDGPLQLGQADGIACRTMEMFEAFDFSERVLKEACWINEVTFWKPDEKQPEQIVRHGRVQDTEDGLSEFPHVVLNQARVHDFYLDVMRNSPSRLEPHYSRRFVDVAVDRGAADYPVTRAAGAHGRRPCGPAGDGEGALCRRLRRRAQRRAQVHRPAAGGRLGQPGLGRDGRAGRHRLSRHPLQGRRCSPPHGNLLVIPREGGYLVRLYVEMDKLGDEERVADRGITHRAAHRRGAAHPAPLHAGGEGGALVVGLRDRPAHLRQVRRRAGAGGRLAPAARVHRRRRLPHAQPQGGPGHELLDAGHLQPRLEARRGAARAVRTASCCTPIRTSARSSRRS